MKIYNPTFEELEAAAGRSGQSQPTEPSAATQDDIQRQAYRLYLEEGCPEGCDMRHWLQAEALLTRR